MLLLNNLLSYIEADFNSINWFYNYDEKWDITYYGMEDM